MKEKIKQYWQQACSDWNYLFKLELKNIVKDEGVLIFFFLVPLAYPLLYSFVYTDEVVREVPIAVVDESHTTMSREYLRHVDASPDVKIINYCADMAEAERCIKTAKLTASCASLLISPSACRKANKWKWASTAT